MGGTFGEVHGAKLVGLLRYARDHQDAPRVVVLAGHRWRPFAGGERRRTGGFRNYSGDFGSAHGGRYCDRHGWRPGRLFWRRGHHRRLLQPDSSLSRGAPVFRGRKSSRRTGRGGVRPGDRPLVWRTTGGKCRRLLGGADAYAEDTSRAFATRPQPARPNPSFRPGYDGKGACTPDATAGKIRPMPDTPEIWKAMGIAEPDRIADLSDEDFNQIAQAQNEANHDAR